MINIRLIEKKDVRDLIDLFLSAREDFPFGFYYNIKRFDEEEIWDVYRGSEENPTFVAEVNGRVVGFVQLERYWSEKDNLYIDLIIVHKDYRGRGIGSKLIERSFEFAVEKKYNILSLNTWLSNRAFNLYERRGFCWITYTRPYMINFLPQLAKSEVIKSLFKEPKELFWSLRGIPRKINVNGHISWEYRLTLNGKSITVAFDEATKKLLRLEIDGDKIELMPPSKRKYLEDEEVEFYLNSTMELPVQFEDKLYIVTNEKLLKLKTKAKKEIKLKVKDLEFAFTLDVESRIGIETITEISTPIFTLATIRLTNNTDEEIKDKLVIEPLDKELEPEFTIKELSLGPKESKEISTLFHGHGKAKIRFAGEEETLTILTPNTVIYEEKSINTALWTVSSDEITYKKRPRLSFWMRYIIAGREIEFELKEKKFVYEADRFKIEMEPEFDGESVILHYKIHAKKELKDTLRIFYWYFVPGRNLTLLLPISIKEWIKAPIILHFPKGYTLIKEKINPPIIANISDEIGFLISYDESGYITLYGGGKPEIIKEIYLGAGETTTFKVAITPTTRKDFEEEKTIEDAIEIKQKENKIVIKNNWFHKIPLKIKINEKEEAIELNSEDEKTLYEVITTECLPIEIEFYGERKTKHIFALKPEKPWKNNSYKTKNMEITLTERGGGIKEIKINGENILVWREEPIPLPGSIYRAYGGTPIHIRKGEKQYDLAIDNWEKVEEGVFKYNHKELEIEITREWNLLDEDTILEIVRVKNLLNKQNNFSVIEAIMIDGEIEEMRDDITILTETPTWYECNRYAWIKTNKGTIIATPLSKETHVEIETPINQTPQIVAKTAIKLNPNQMKEYKMIIMTKKDSLEKYARCIKKHF